MKNFKMKVNVLNTVLIILFSTMLCFSEEPSLTTAESIAHGQLKEAFNLPNGPATRISSFYIKGIGFFLILNCDLSFNSIDATPFGSNAKKKKAILETNKIYDEMKSAIIKVGEFLKIDDKEKIFLVVIDSKVFKSPFEKVSAKKEYKVSMNVNNRDKSKISID